jgi:hypothetical protein
MTFPVTPGAHQDLFIRLSVRAGLVVLRRGAIARTAHRKVLPQRGVRAVLAVHVVVGELHGQGVLMSVAVLGRGAIAFDLCGE